MNDQSSTRHSNMQLIPLFSPFRSKLDHGIRSLSFPRFMRHEMTSNAILSPSGLLLIIPFFPGQEPTYFFPPPLEFPFPVFYHLLFCLSPPFPRPVGANMMVGH